MARSGSLESEIILETVFWHATPRALCCRAERECEQERAGSAGSGRPLSRSSLGSGGWREPLLQRRCAALPRDPAARRPEEEWKADGSRVGLRRGSSALPHPRTFNNVWGHFWLSRLRPLGTMLLACSGEKMTGEAGGGLLVTTPQCSGRCPQQRIIQPKMPVLPRLCVPCPGHTRTHAHRHTRTHTHTHSEIGNPSLGPKCRGVAVAWRPDGE